VADGCRGLAKTLGYKRISRNESFWAEVQIGAELGKQALQLVEPVPGVVASGTEHGKFTLLGYAKPEIS